MKNGNAGTILLSHAGLASGIYFGIQTTVQKCSTSSINIVKMGLCAHYEMIEITV